MMMTIGDIPPEIAEADTDKAFDLAEEWSVGMDHCVDLDEMKDRLIYHWKKTNGLMKDLEEVEDIMRTVRIDDVSRRSALLKICQQQAELLNKVDMDVALHRHMSNESITKTFYSAYTKYTGALTSEHCPIVFAGETSSGKSSLLNLLLGQESEVLPVQLLPCTSTICEISYGQSTQCKAIMPHGAPTEFKYEDREKYIYKKEDRQRTFTHESVQLQLPIPILQSGLTFIDTPGIGENTTMGSVLLKYIEKHDIYGFVYVIKSDNSGGVAKDRLIYLLQQLLQLKDEAERPKFDPKMALFICNRWDMVKKPDREEVREHIIERLTEAWPGFDPNRQLLMMDSKMALVSWKLGYITDDYSALLDSLRVVLPQTLQRRTLDVYTWAEKVILRLLHAVRTCLRFADSTTLDSSSVRQMQQMLADLGDKINQFSAELDEFIRHGKVHLVQELHEYINSAEVERRMTGWDKTDVPRAVMRLDWDTLVERLREVIDIRVASVITHWEADNHFTRCVQERTFRFVNREFSSIKENMQQVEKIIRNKVLDGHTFSEIVQQVSKDMKFVPENKEKKVKELLDFETKIIRTISEAEYKKLTTLQRMQERFINGPLYMSLSDEHYIDMNEEQFREDPVQFLSDLSARVLEYYREKDAVWELVNFQMKDLEEYLFKDVVNESRDIVSSNAAILTMVIDDIDGGNVKKNISDKAVYLKLESQVFGALHTTKMFFNKYLRKYDYMDSELDYLSEQESKLPIAEGTCAPFATALLTDSGRKVTVKRQSSLKGIFALSEEETYLRLLCGKDRHIPSLLGLMQGPTGMPNLILEGHLLPARQFYMKPHLTAPGDRHTFLDRYKVLVNELIHAVAFLHLQQLVHAVLSLDSVLVDSMTGIPKLTCLGEPRFLEGTPQMTETIGPLVLLAPEVLGGELYQSSADVYSLALLIAELWNHKQAFFEFQRTYCNNFLQVISNPDQRVLRNCLRLSTMPELLAKLVQHAACVDAKNRPSILKTQVHWITFLRATR